MQKRIIILLLCLCVKTSGSQNVLSGRVLSLETKKVIPFAAVYLIKNNTGTYSDSSGKFILKHRDSILFDTLVISSLGYKTFKQPVKNVKSLQSEMFFLSQSEIKLQVIEVSGRESKKFQAGIINKKPIGKYAVCANYYFQIGRVFRLDTLKGKCLKINKIRYYIGKEGNHNAPFRIRIYTINKSSQKPGNDLFIIDGVYQSSVKNKWFSINLENKDLLFSPQEIFVAMEWLPSKSKYTYRSKEGRSCFGQTLGMTNSIGEHQYYIKSDLNDWWRPEFPNSPYTTNPMIDLEIEIINR